MMSMRIAGALLALLVIVGRVTPQARPDFSGTWVATKDAPSNTGAAAVPVLGQQFAVRQDGQTMTVMRPIRGTIVSATFSLDGSEVHTRIPGGLCMADSESVETAAWDGDAVALTVVGSIPPGGTTVAKLNVRRVLRLADAGTLVAEGNMRDNAQAQPKTVGTVYKRSAEPMVAPATSGPTSVRATIAQLSWLSGVWIGSSGSDERWTPAASGSMIGVSRTLRNNVLSEFEFLCIVQRAGGLVYQAMPNGRSPATDFTLTKIETNSATFENPAHDFPKMIRYSLLPDGTLEAVVGGDPKQRAITFTFKRQQ